MNTILRAIGILAVLLIVSISAFAGDAPAKQSSSWWTDFSVSPYGAVTHPNLTDKAIWGAGLDVGYNINHTVSLHVANLAHENDNWRGQVIDETSLLVRADLVRYSKERFVGYVLAGGDRDWDHSDWGFSAGLGAEIRLAKNVSVGVDSRIRAWFKNEKDLQTRGFLSFRF